MQDFKTNFEEEPLIKVATEYVYDYETGGYENSSLEQLLFENVLGGRYEINSGTGSMKPGGQAILYYCHKKNNINCEYVVKLYDLKAFPKESSVDDFYFMLEKLKGIKSDYIVNVAEYGRFKAENTEYIYALTPRYLPFPENRYEIQRVYLDENYERRFIILVRCFYNALKVLEEHSIVHCDIKKSNIMWNDEAGCPVLIDFAGAIHHGSDDKSRIVTATTAWNFPPEATIDKTANKFTDFYMLGLALLDIISGGKKTYQNYAVYSKPVPKGLPISVYFLLEGLLYSDNSGKLYKKYRFDCERLAQWLEKAESGGFEKEDISKYIRNDTFSSIAEISSADLSTETASRLDIKYPITIEKNDRQIVFYSDGEIAAAMAEDNDWGYNLIMNEAEFYFQNSPLIKKKSAELIALDEEEKYAQRDAAYVKFVLNNLPEERKNMFFHPELPNVKTIGAFGDELRKILFETVEFGYNVKKTNNETSIMKTARIISEIFKTDILSFYFELCGNKELLELSSSLEESFKNCRQYNPVDMLKLTYAICDNKICRVNGKWYADIDQYYEYIKQLFENEEYEQLAEEKRKVIDIMGNTVPSFSVWAKATRKQG